MSSFMFGKNGLWSRVSNKLDRAPNWIKSMDRVSLQKDFFAGLTGAVVVLPQGVAFAAIAGLPSQYGLYTAIVPAIIAALFGSSLHLISGPTTAISIVVFATLSPLAEPGSPSFITMAFTLAFLAGLFQFVLGLVRMGGLVDFVSHSVVVGFTSGASILIATSQLKHLFGVSLPNGESFIHTWIDLIDKIPAMNPYVLLVGSVTLATAILVKKILPKWPDMLVALTVGSFLAFGVGVSEHQIALVGSFPNSLPPLSVPDFSLSTIRELSSGALAIALLGLIEAVSIARSVALHSGQRINGNQEFIGQGLANIVGSFFSAYPSSGSFTRTGVNYSAGAKTPFSAIFAALFLMGIILLVAPLAAHLPIAAMAGVILRVAYKLIDFHHIRQIFKSTNPGTAVMLVTFAATLFLELEFAIYVGIMLSLSLYLKRTSNPKVMARVPDPNSPWRRFVSDKNLTECPQLKILRIDGSLYFGSASHVGSILRKSQERQPEQRNLLVIGSGINFADLSGAEMLRNESERRRSTQGNLFLCDIKEQVQQVFDRSGYINSIGEDHIFRSKNEAIQSICSQFLDKNRCRTCPHEVFMECTQFNLNS
ncbi:MAG: SulP family inorganic anion transporter [Magnetococcales bacterium]|nr:SulP family inorganic anion transporter [Magnetococcales bacterium]